VPIVSLSTTSLTFSAQAIGTSSTSQQVTLTNSGDASLTISNIGVSGDFSETNNCGLGLGSGSAGNTCQISVIFSPSALGTRTGALSITDSAAGSPHMVSLSGQAASPSLGLGLPPGGSSTAVVNAGSPASYTLSIGGGGVGGMASLSCTGAPTGASCSLTSTLSVNATTAATFNVTVSTTPQNSAPAHYNGFGLWQSLGLWRFPLATHQEDSETLLSRNSVGSIACVIMRGRFKQLTTEPEWHSSGNLQSEGRGNCGIQYPEHESHADGPLS
jgi:hypothetical protein